MTTIEREQEIFDELQHNIVFVDNYVIYNALMLYYASLTRIPGGYRSVPNFDAYERSIVRIVNESADILTDLVAGYLE